MFSVQCAVSSVEIGQWTVVLTREAALMLQSQPPYRLKGYSNLALWHICILALWHSVTLEVLHSGSLEVCHYGTLALWQSGTLAVWHIGSLAV